MFCPVCLRESHCPCKSCEERFPTDKLKYIVTGDNNRREECPHCGFNESSDFLFDYECDRIGYFNGTDKLADIDLEKARTNIYSTRMSINKILDAELERVEYEYEKFCK